MTIPYETPRIEDFGTLAELTAGKATFGPDVPARTGTYGGSYGGGGSGSSSHSRSRSSGISGKTTHSW